ncbi:hypothetical protein EBM89_07545 [Cellulomonas triticagri]|uniref:D-ribose pyranase n=1 Tax=Cellulomonas triticagri TaxID=2483352 RepID=A0A3M2JPQ3_9CELL|nr:hypothetical protein EBM89_07545 [Cellulomonas triticagri]
MRRSGVLDPALAARLARLGHGHLVLVVDCGTPVGERRAAVRGGVLTTVRDGAHDQDLRPRRATVVPLG